MPPKVLEKTYEIREQIGSGGGGVVYLAWHIRLEKLVVLKADKRGLSAKMDRLRTEVNALKDLHHSHIPQVYDFIEDGGTVYTVMEYIEGESFDKPLGRGERFAQAQVVRWLKQLLQALVYLHSRPPYGILHSDIKPANVMLTPSGDTRLIDFNIALALGEDGAAAVGASRGYASPEHYGPQELEEATGRRRVTPVPGRTVALPGLETTVSLSSASSGRSGKRLVDVRSDIYSLGATIYHILSGNRPAPKAREVIPLPCDAYSPGLVRIITKAMNPDPDLRYQSAGEMLSDVNALHHRDPRYLRLIRAQRCVCAVCSAIFLLSGACAFTGLKRLEQTQNALVQAEYSSNALANGDQPAALRHAMAALPGKTNFFTPPPTPKAQKALSEALGVYDLSDGYEPWGVIELPSAPLTLTVSPKGQWAAAVCAYEMVLFEPESLRIIDRLPAVQSALAEAEFTGSQLLYAGETGLCAYDMIQRKLLWQGRAATAVAVSADGSKVAAVDRDTDQAVIYAMDGREIAVISFDGKRQRVPSDDSFGNPKDSLFALNRDGSLLAVSFSDGSLEIFRTETGESIVVQQPMDAVHFEGGFNGDYFAFSSIGESGRSVFAVINVKEWVQTGGFQSESPYGVQADESGICVSSENLLVQLDPVTGEQRELAYLEDDIISFSVGKRDILAATQTSLQLLGGSANQIGTVLSDYPFHFMEFSGDIALAGGRDSPALRILRRRTFNNAPAYSYDADYPHDEARINAAGNRIMLFSYRGFQLYDQTGVLLDETSIPDGKKVYDQQFSSESGNLIVVYPTALRIYSGANGGLLLERTGLRSVFYSPYGVSILEQDGTLSLVDLDTALQQPVGYSSEEFAAWCGRVVDDAFLRGRQLIGAARSANGHLFAISDGESGAVYDENGRQRFAFSASGRSEAFFAGDFMLLSPQHGTPAAYRLKDGKKIRNLLAETFMTYVTAVNGGLICEYVTADGKRAGLLLDHNCETLAAMPNLTDIVGNQVFFDYRAGYIRGAPLFSLDELVLIARQREEAG